MIAVEDSIAKEVVAANVRRLLRKRGWSGRRLALETGDNPVTINRLLRGENVPGIGIVSRVATALDTSVDFLLKIHEEEPANA